MADDNLTALAQRFQELRSRPGKYGGGEHDEVVDSPDGEKFQVMEALGDQLGLPGTPAADILSRLGKPDELTLMLPHNVVPTMPGPAILSGSVEAESLRQQQQPFYFVYYWRHKHDYLYFKIDPVKETVITSQWYNTAE
ncbi:hypothetical protein DFQ28_008534 [Apophysomyces sp. BC1034]|nr:hypothetical protein DFQ30_000196 [Apophysomyces sp. BC1015]KAG0175950.1 hypothetical protein DFQ29_006740 [Apophysomyces sp. BC1021]KAG0185942.1 hypothetical protein DFQ28_008534 [Apophysomyces sp. BC1034]